MLPPLSRRVAREGEALSRPPSNTSGTPHPPARVIRTLLSPLHSVPLPHSARATVGCRRQPHR
eukprot:470380-Pleurochrysis_carterae.AAC.1